MPVDPRRETYDRAKLIWRLQSVTDHIADLKDQLEQLTIQMRDFTAQAKPGDDDERRAGPGADPPAP